MSDIEKLRLIISEEREGYIQDVENCLVELFSSIDENTLLGLFTLFDDKAADEAMFLIIHTIESVDDSLYCKCLLASVELLWRHAPRWAQIIHIRVMNAPATLSVYLKLSSQTSDSSRHVIDEIYRAIESGWPKIASKARAARDAM